MLTSVAQARTKLSMFIAVVVVSSLAAQAQPEPLTLRLNDAVGRPGGITALVFRTYASRPAGQGQICGTSAFAPFAGQSTPFTALVGTEVLTPTDDARARGALVDVGGQQSVMTRFRSPSKTINSVDGPLAVFFLRLDPNLIPGSEYNLVIDPADTFLLDPDGAPIVLDPVSGTLEILSPAAGYPVAAEGDKIAPGETALLGFETAEPRRLSGGRVAIEYDPAIADGTPVVRMNPGYGNAEFTVDDLTPGLIVVDFTSLDRTLNRIPGSIIEIDLPTSEAVPRGTRSAVSLVGELTFLEDARGDLLTLTLEAPGEIEFE